MDTVWPDKKLGVTWTFSYRTSKIEKSSMLKLCEYGSQSARAQNSAKNRWAVIAVWASAKSARRCISIRICPLDPGTTCCLRSSWQTLALPYFPVETGNQRPKSARPALIPNANSFHPFSVASGPCNRLAPSSHRKPCFCCWQKSQSQCSSLTKCYCPAQSYKRSVSGNTPIHTIAQTAAQRILLIPAQPPSGDDSKPAISSPRLNAPPLLSHKIGNWRGRKVLFCSKCCHLGIRAYSNLAMTSTTVNNRYRS